MRLDWSLEKGKFFIANHPQMNHAIMKCLKYTLLIQGRRKQCISGEKSNTSQHTGLDLLSRVDACANLPDIRRWRNGLRSETTKRLAINTELHENRAVIIKLLHNTISTSPRRKDVAVTKSGASGAKICREVPTRHRTCFYPPLFESSQSRQSGSSMDWGTSVACPLTSGRHCPQVAPSAAGRSGLQLRLARL